MAEPISVRVVLPGDDEVDVGTLRFTRARGRENTIFTYSQSYLGDARAYPIDPALQLQHGQFVPTERARSEPCPIVRRTGGARDCCAELNGSYVDRRPWWPVQTSEPLRG